MGAGVIAPFHARSIAALPNARLRAVVDVVPELAEQQAAEWGCDGYTDVRAVLDRTDIDVVCVCVPSGLHAEIGTQVAACGKHVVVEKPIEVSLEAADRLIGACRQHGVKLAVISQHRFDPGIRRLHEAVMAGRLGRLLLGDTIIKWYRTQQYYDSAGWRATWELDGGGALMNQGVHYVDLLQWLMGPVDRVVARCATGAHAIPVEDVALALLTFASGALGVIEASTAAYPGFPERLEITGSGGTAIVAEGEVVAWELKDEKGETGPYGAKVRFHQAVAPSAARTETGAAQKTAGHRTQLADLLDAIATGRDPVITGEEARKPLEIILAIYQSARTEREVALPLASVTRL
ncbi:MAG TPA: Gfo/Idh/MocA family oxidoreductase [Candidatus Dormibacteraeota bacterium]|nr:Gfo/Idh/MocA family oxidoreductase [Candidatus Dormibacteraeota bacterium]